jgi:membrane protease YdiL (CAAX protease family)
MLAGDKFTGLLLNLGIIAVLPALGEEFIFRGVLQTLLTKWFKNTHLAIFIAAFLFSSIHLQFYGFIPRLVLGLFFGYLFFWSKNIWLAVWAHLINNALAIILMFLGNKGNINIPEILTENHHVSMIEFGISLCMIVILTGILYSTTKRARRTIIKDDIKIS